MNFSGSAHPDGVEISAHERSLQAPYRAFREESGEIRVEKLKKAEITRGDPRELISAALTLVAAAAVGAIGLSAATGVPVWAWTSAGVAAFTLVAMWQAMPPRSALKRYHGAEHKVINAFERGEHSLDAAARQSRIAARCGSNLVFACSFSVIASLTLYGPHAEHSLLLTLLLHLLMPPAAIVIALFVVKVLSNDPHGKVLLWPLLQLQRLVTSEPTLEELEVAYVAACAARSVFQSSPDRALHSARLSKWRPNPAVLAAHSKISR